MDKMIELMEFHTTHLEELGPIFLSYWMIHLTQIWDKLLCDLLIKTEQITKMTIRYIAFLKETLL